MPSERCAPSVREEPSAYNNTAQIKPTMLIDLPIGKNLALMNARLYKRKPTKSEVHNYVEIVMSYYQGKRRSPLPDSFPLSTILDECKIDSHKLCEVIGCNPKTIRNWKHNPASIRPKMFHNLCEGMVEAAPTAKDAWFALVMLCLSSDETPEDIQTRIEQNMRNEIAIAGMKLDGAALYTLYLNACALLQTLPREWNTDRKEELSLTEKAELQVDTLYGIDAATKDTSQEEKIF